MFKKVIIWGCFTGSHSYIHSAYFKAFKHLGYETFWTNNLSEVGNTKDCLFLTENQHKNGMPIQEHSYYVLHHIDNEIFLNRGCKLINLCNFVKIPLENNKNWNYPESKGVLEKVNSHVYYDRTKLALYQPWATNLLPEEIKKEPQQFISDRDEINFVGSVWSENINECIDFFVDCHKKNIKVNIYGWLQFPNLLDKLPNIRHYPNEASDEDKARQVVEKSYIYPDIRCQHHKNLGYIPCRLFKNISYGCIPCTNSKACYDFFGEMLPYSEKTSDFIDSSINYFKKRDIEKEKYLINVVKNEHTYLNRVNEITKYFKLLYD